MKKYFLHLACFTTIIISTLSCRMNIMKGEGKKVTTTPAVSSFNAVDVGVPVKAVITLQAGATPGIQFNGYENIINHLKTRIENNTLHIYSDLDDTWSMDCNDVTAQITLPSITSLSLEGSPDADVHGNITGSDFKLDISGAANVTIDNINVDNFSSTVSGAANIEVMGGIVKHATYEISGAGKIRAYPLQASETSATISGAGTSQVTALEKLTASISGAGAIHYKGHPTVDKDVSGVGTVTDAN